MMAQDYAAKLSDLQQTTTNLKEQVDELTKQLSQVKNHTLLENSDWDNATLMQEWGICERTAANYRKQGLGFFKRGGRIFYSSESRNAFKRRRAAV
jgi:hypothetical protein